MWLVRLKFRIWDRYLSDNNSGMGVVEVILIILVLIGLVVIFKSQITSVVSKIFKKITAQINTF